MFSKFRRFAFGLGVSSTLVLPSLPAQAMDEGWFVVVGVMPAEPYDTAAGQKLQDRIEPCGFKTFNDFSAKFAGFTPGFTVFVLGAYASKTVAETIMSEARKCVPDAYVKRGKYLGE